jgi:hypothetical protein
MALLNLSGWARGAEPSPAHHYIQAKTLEISRVFLKYKKDKEFIRYGGYKNGIGMIGGLKNGTV